MAMKRFWYHFCLVVWLLACLADYAVGLGYFFAAAKKDGAKLPYFTLSLVS